MQMLRRRRGSFERKLYSGYLLDFVFEIPLVLAFSYLFGSVCCSRRLSQSYTSHARLCERFGSGIIPLKIGSRQRGTSPLVPSFSGRPGNAGCPASASTSSKVDQGEVKGRECLADLRHYQEIL